MKTPDKKCSTLEVHDCVSSASVRTNASSKKCPAEDQEKIMERILEEFKESHKKRTNIQKNWRQLTCRAILAFIAADEDTPENIKDGLQPSLREEKENQEKGFLIMRKLLISSHYRRKKGRETDR